MAEESKVRIIEVEAQYRDEEGRRASRRLRKQGWIPANLYGPAIEGSIPIKIKRRIAQTLASQYRVFFALVKLPDEKKYKTIVKEIQFHPVTDEVLHIDFQAVEAGRPIVTEVPLKLVGIAEGVVKGGMLVKKVRKLPVEVLPEKLEEILEADVSHLDLGQSLRVKDIKKEGWRILYPPEVPLATVEIPRKLRVQQEEEKKEEQAKK